METLTVRLDISRSLDARHLRALEEIRAQVGDMFQRDACFWSRSPHQVLLLDWPLHHQDPGKAERSNKVAITFGSDWLDAFGASEPRRRIGLLAEVRAAISARMGEFQDGHDLSAVNEASTDSFQISLR